MRLAILLLLAACATSKTQEAHSTFQNSEQALLSEGKQVEQHTEAGPETITTTVEEFSLPQKEVVPSDPEIKETSEHPAQRGVSVAQGASSDARRGPLLVKRTVTVDRRGPVVQDTSLQAQGSLRTHAEAKADAEAHSQATMKPSGLLGGLMALWPEALFALLACTAFAVWRLKPSWLTAILKVFTQ